MNSLIQDKQIKWTKVLKFDDLKTKNFKKKSNGKSKDRTLEEEKTMFAHNIC